MAVITDDLSKAFRFISEIDGKPPPAEKYRCRLVMRDHSIYAVCLKTKDVYFWDSKEKEWKKCNYGLF